MTVSRQRLHQKKLIAEGRCFICGKKRKHYAAACDKHALEIRVAARRRRREKVGIPVDAPLSKRGRPPKVSS